MHQFSKGLYMTLLDVLILLLVAGICGALGQAITGFSRGGCLVSIALGFVGAIVGMWLARAVGLPELFAVQIGTTNFPIVWSIIGSALFVAVIALLTRSLAVYLLHAPPLTWTEPPTHVRVYPCPACQETISVAATSCRFCHVPTDLKVAEQLWVENQQLTSAIPRVLTCTDIALVLHCL